MAKTGSNDKIKKNLLKVLSHAQIVHDKAENVCPERKAFSGFHAYVTRELDNALEEKNYELMFDLEEMCQEHDVMHRSSDIEKSLKFLSDLKGMRERFFEFQNPEKVKEFFLPVQERVKKHDERMIDGAFKRDSEALRRFLRGHKSPCLVPAVNSFYEKRIDCAKEIYKELQRNIDFALGYDKGKEQSKDFGR